MEKPRLTELSIDSINKFITCGICKGYLRDAHAIIHCLHAFCRECISKRVEYDNNSSCPKCGGTISESGSKVFENNIKSDRTLQAFTDNVLRALQAQTGYKIHMVSSSFVSDQSLPSLSSAHDHHHTSSSSSSSAGATAAQSSRSSLSNQKDQQNKRGRNQDDENENTTSSNSESSTKKQKKTNSPDHTDQGVSSSSSVAAATSSSTTNNGKEKKTESEAAGDDQSGNMSSGVEFQMIPYETEKELPSLQKPWMRTLKTTTILKLRKFLAKKFELEPESLEILCNNEVLACNNTLGVEQVLNSIWIKRPNATIEDFTLNYRKKR